MKLTIDTDALWHRIRRAFWRWTTRRYQPGFHIPGRCADCGIPLTYAECTYYGKTCERCEGIAFHAQQAAELPTCADTGAPKDPRGCWNVRCQLGGTCCLPAGVAVVAPLAQQLATAVDAIDAGHDAFCMMVLRGKECTCGVTANSQQTFPAHPPMDPTP